MKVGFVGAGAIGAPMIARLVGAGHTVQAFGRSDASRRRAVEAGAALVDSTSAVCRGAQGVVLCPYTDDEVQDIAVEFTILKSLEPGACLILHTTGSPLTAQ